MPGLALLYHAVMERPAGCDDKERELFVSPAEFEKQMADLARRGLRSVSIESFPKSSHRSVLITFDDAYAHVDETVAPILAKFGFHAVMFVAPAHLGGKNTWDAELHPRLAALDIASPEMIASMSRGRWEIESHGLWHHDLREVGHDVLLYELTESRRELSEITGKPVTALAYPYGYVDDRVERAAREAGYGLAFTATPGPTGNDFRLPRQPIAGSDDIRVVSLKMSRLFHGLGAIYAMTPAGARGKIRAALNRAAGWAL
jgi:peptidoglycan/xylan/chitin deacetylase (PgdA/CDA1 family)